MQQVPGPVLPDLSIRQLEYLVAVADTRTWAAAAESVGVSPSALSQGLAELERRLGIELFDRVGRRRALRDAAGPVLAHARQVLGLTGDLVRWADRERSGLAGRVRVGMIDAAATIHHVDQLRRFRRERPDVDLHLTVAPSGELLEQLAAGRIDLAIAVQPGDADPAIATQPMLSEELWVYAPPGAEPGSPDSWGPWVLFPEGSHTRAVIAEELVAVGAHVDVIAESHQPDVLAEMVQLGLGWTVLPVTQAERNDPPLRPVRALTERTLVAAWRRGSVRPPALDELIDLLSPGQAGGVSPASTRRN